MEIWIRLQKFSSDLHVQKNCSQMSFTNISDSQRAFHKYLHENLLDSLLVSVGLFNFVCHSEMLAGRVDRQLKIQSVADWTSAYLNAHKLHIQSGTLYHIRAPRAEHPHWRFVRKVCHFWPGGNYSCFLFTPLNIAFTWWKIPCNYNHLSVLIIIVKIKIKKDNILVSKSPREHFV